MTALLRTIPLKYIFIQTSINSRLIVSEQPIWKMINYPQNVTKCEHVKIPIDMSFFSTLKTHEYFRHTKTHGYFRHSRNTSIFDIQETQVFKILKSWVFSTSLKYWATEICVSYMYPKSVGISYPAKKKLRRW